MATYSKRIKNICNFIERDKILANFTERQFNISTYSERDKNAAAFTELTIHPSIFDERVRNITTFNELSVNPNTWDDRSKNTADFALGYSFLVDENKIFIITKNYEKILLGTASSAEPENNTFTELPKNSSTWTDR